MRNGSAKTFYRDHFKSLTILKGTVCCDNKLFIYDAASNACTTLDLCSPSYNDCHEHAVCENIQPSGRTCTCKKGYVGDGIILCEDEDNCVAPPQATPSTGPNWSICGPFANCVDKIGLFFFILRI